MKTIEQLKLQVLWTLDQKYFYSFYVKRVLGKGSSKAVYWANSAYYPFYTEVFMKSTKISVSEFYTKIYFLF